MIFCNKRYTIDGYLLGRYTTVSDNTQDGSLSENLAILASLLDQFASGSGRITPRVRGSRLDVDVRTKLEEVLASVEAISNELMTLENLMIFGNGCYAVGRHLDASKSYLMVLEDDPVNADARFN